jgi:hypothetical protein
MRAGCGIGRASGIREYLSAYGRVSLRGVFGNRRLADHAEGLGAFPFNGEAREAASQTRGEHHGSGRPLLTGSSSSTSNFNVASGKDRLPLLDASGALPDCRRSRRSTWD